MFTGPSTDNIYVNSAAVNKERKHVSQDQGDNTYYNFGEASDNGKTKIENLKEYVRMKKDDAKFFEEEFKVYF